MRLRRHFQHEHDTGIDLAPMLDFVLNLLIFFIITAVFVKEAGLPVSRHGGGATGPATGPETGSISVVIRESGEVLVDNRLVDVRAVRANIERLHAQKPEWGVMVTTQQDATTEVLVLVLDQIRQGGVENISFGTASG
jgi:biopolymer transport protein ExbD